MKRKEYLQPTIEIIGDTSCEILAGTLATKPGNTNEQLAKQSDFTDFDDEDSEEFNWEEN